jgi:Xaa-Pro aminopeptidase
MSSLFRNRIKRVQQVLKKIHPKAALILSSNVRANRSRDTYFPFRQQSDLLYLTGSSSEGLALLVKADRTNPLIITNKPTKHQIIWDGRHTDAKALSKNLQIEVREVNQVIPECLKEITGVFQLFFNNDKGGIAKTIVDTLLSKSSYEISSLPRIFGLSDVIMEQLRIRKDRHEIATIKRAIKVTGDSLNSILPHIISGVSELEISRALEAEFLIRGAVPAFRSIVASGPSASVLHYSHQNRRLKNGEFVLIDCGAEVDGYAADVTRCIPVGGKEKASGIWVELFNLVLNMQDAALSKVQKGASINTVHEAAVITLVDGLKYLKILKGSTDSIINKKLYQPFFPHSIGHSLGLDVHDLGSLRSGKGNLEEGMVLTIEPGIYIKNRLGSVPAGGIRIEDDVLVTANGYELLSKNIPRSLAD